MVQHFSLPQIPYQTAHPQGVHILIGTRAGFISFEQIGSGRSSGLTWNCIMNDKTDNIFTMWDIFSIFF